ncbi:MAG: hypothetical protein LBJ73_03915 [Rickettsiales bacterium]|jgi:hypothetical protein|nr:hypothetical protein [Rickettsiales bacterium]
MKKTLLAGLFAALPFSVYADDAPKTPYETIAAVIEDCEVVRAPSETGDFIVQCTETDELINISKSDANAKFSTGTPTGDEAESVNPDMILVNVVPSESCYRVLAESVDMNNLPDDYWAVLVCKD